MADVRLSSTGDADVDRPCNAFAARAAVSSSAAVLSAEYLPLVALARYSGLSVRTLRTYLQHRARPLPHFRIGGKLLVKRSDFDLWAEQFRASARESVDALVTEALRGL